MTPDDVFKVRGKNIDPLAREDIRPFAAEAIAEVITLPPHTVLKQIRTTVSQHVVWCYSQGLPLKRDVVWAVSCLVDGETL